MVTFAFCGVLFLVRREEHVQHFEPILRPPSHQEADELAWKGAQGPQLEGRLNLPGYGDRNGHGGKYLCRLQLRGSEMV
jgi:hypothetical protein